MKFDPSKEFELESTVRKTEQHLIDVEIAKINLWTSMRMRIPPEYRNRIEEFEYDGGNTITIALRYTPLGD